MDDAALLCASQHERALYEELCAAYRALATLLADGGTALDPGRMAAERERADAATAVLGTIAATIAPHRLGGRPVAAAVREEWRISAVLAAEAAEANARLITLARTRQVDLRARLAQASRTRRVLRGYRPPGGARSVSLERA
jgi:hypothetical protein